MAMGKLGEKSPKFWWEKIDKMKTLVIGYGHPFNDKRVMRTVMALKKLGTVYYQYAGNSEELIDGVKTFPLKKPYAKNPLRRYIQRGEFDRKILRLVETLDYDLVYFHYFPASMPLKIFRSAKKRRKTLVYELHEIIPIQFLTEKYEFLSFAMWNVFKKQLQLSDATVCVSKEALDFMLEKTEINRPSFILPSYASKSFTPKPKELRKKEIVYVGKVQRSTKNEKVLLLNLKSKGFTLKSIGMNWNIADISIPFLPYPDMMKKVASSAFSLISFQSRKDINYPNDIYSLPNKLFDSVAAGTPVIVNSRFKSMVSLVKKYNVGILIGTTQPVHFITKKIVEAWNNYETLLKAVKLNNRHFVWDEKKEQEFINFILEVIR